MEFQARHLCVAAEAHQRYPAEASFGEAVHHGYRYLTDVMWDREHGGWFHRTDRQGRILESETKHAHGICYGIDACLAVHQATGNPAALELAKAGFSWLDQHAHDPEFGGYFGFLTRDGKVLRPGAASQWPHHGDTIGTPLGFKDLNVHSDLLETFQVLYRVWPDPQLEVRLSELFTLILRRFLVPDLGAMHYYFTADWRPIPHLVRCGYQFQAAYRLTMALELLDRQDERLRQASALLDHTLRHAQDPNGGFYYATAGDDPIQLEGGLARAAGKSWWVQFEALKAFLAMSRLVADPNPYRTAFLSTWEYLDRAFLDRRFGGVFIKGIDQLSPWQSRLGMGWPDYVTRKGTDWKDARHEARSLLYCLEHYPGK